MYNARHKGLNHWKFGLGLVVMLLLGCGQPGSGKVIIYNANILTMDLEQPYAQALAIEDGVFVAVGNNQDIQTLADSNTREIDAQGRTLVPGFNDAHLHSILIPPSAIDAGRMVSIDELVDALINKAPDIEQGQWLMAYGYDDTLFGRHLNRGDLDRVSTTQPVLVMHASGHLYAANSLAFAVAKINAGTQDPKGGKFYRDDNGNPVGLISERPAVEMLFNPSQPSFLPKEPMLAVKNLRAFFALAHSLGITSFGEAMVPPELSLAYWFADPEAHGIRVNLMLDGEDLDGARSIKSLNDLLEIIGIGLFDQNWLRAKTVKLFHGHSLSGRTARLFEPYADRPDYYGEMPQRSQTELDQIIQDIHALGFQAAVHANGDFEVDMVLKAFYAANKRQPRDHRHRLEHASILNQELLDSIKKQSVVIAPHSYIFEKGPMIEAYGEERWPWMFANQSIVSQGIVNAANSDFPIAALPPMLRIQSLVTRTSRFGKTYAAEQRLTVEQALFAYTMGSAYASFDEKTKGSIEAGKFADFVLLSDDPREVVPQEINKISVMQTWVAGLLRYSRDDE